MKKPHIIIGTLFALAIAGHGQVSNPQVRDSATDPTGVACTSAAPILRYTAAGTSTYFGCTGNGGTVYAALGSGSGGGTPSNAIVGSVTGLNSPEWINTLGNLSYVSGDPMGFRIIDVSNPAAPKVLSSESVGSSAFGNYLVYPYVYLTIAGLNGSGPGGLQVVDVTNPSNPILKGSSLDMTRRFSEGIVVKGNYAYVANQSQNSIDVYDISDPTNPTYLSRLTDAAIPHSVQVLILNGNYIYLPIQTSPTGITVVSLAVPATPAVVTNVPFGNGAVLSGSHLYVANGDFGLLTVLDVSTPAAPTVVGNVFDQRLLFGSNPGVIGDYVYVASFNTPGAITAVNVSDPTKPYVVSGVIGKTPNDLLDSASGCFASQSGGQYLYCSIGFLGGGGNAFDVIDTSALIAPSLISTNLVGTPGPIFSTATTQLYACNSDSILAIAGVSDAISLTPGTAYSVSAGAGSDTVNVQCTLTGSTYGWKTM